MCLQTLFVFRTTLNTSFISAIPFAHLRSLRYQPQMQIVIYMKQDEVLRAIRRYVSGGSAYTSKNDSIFILFLFVSYNDETRRWCS